jgi:hypothetical protein
MLLGATLAAAAGVGVVLLARGGGDSKATTPPQAEAPAPAAAPVAAPVAAPATAPAQGKLAITVNVANARIEVDGRTLTTSADHATVQVDAGDHTVVVTAPRRKSFDKKVTVTPGAEVAVKVHLDRGGGSTSAPGAAVDLTDAKPTTTTTTSSTDKPPADTTTTTTQKKPTDIDAVADPFARPKKK